MQRQLFFFADEGKLSLLFTIGGVLSTALHISKNKISN